jgi:hypothetical protein
MMVADIAIALIIGGLFAFLAAALFFLVNGDD